MQCNARQYKCEAQWNAASWSSEMREREAACSVESGEWRVEKAEGREEEGEGIKDKVDVGVEV